MRNPRPFIITGLPRSRTAWAANLFCTGNITCRHEFTSTLEDPWHLIPALRNLPGTFVGTADTAAPLFLEGILDQEPDIPVVILERDLAEVVLSLRKLGFKGIAPLIGQAKAALDRISSRPNVITVPWWQLDYVSVAKDIQRHIAPGERFDVDRFEMLKDFKVEIMPHRWQQLAERADVLAKG